MPEDAYATEIIDARVSFHERALATPLVLSSGPITRITEAQATVRVRVGGRVAEGRGSIYLSDLWAWPEPILTHAQRDTVLRRICERIAADLGDLVGQAESALADGPQAHPLELGLRLHGACCHKETQRLCAGLLPEAVEVSALAMAMCASPFDAALHDAVGIALDRSALDLYDAGAKLPLADRWLSGDAAGAIRRLLDRPAKQNMPAWWIVGKNDPLPDALVPPVRRRGIRCFKLKITGADPRADAALTAAVFEAACDLGARDAMLSVDSNEANPDATSVNAYLDALQARSAPAYAALAYLEQPTGRDIRRHAFDWHSVAARKPVMLDEGLTSLDLLDEARRQGWSGLALKTCKGHSFVLVAAAWAHQRGIRLSLQDLTNPGHAAIHAAVLASRLPTINGVELNSPQFTPEANAPWLPRWSGVFDPREGVHRLPAGRFVGLGMD